MILKNRQNYMYNPQRGKDEICFGSFKFNLVNGNLYMKNINVPLTSAESKLLMGLARKAGEVITRSEMFRLLFVNSVCSRRNIENVNYENLRIVDTQIARLRNKLKGDVRHKEFLQTVRGRGYILWPTFV